MRRLSPLLAATLVASTPSFARASLIGTTQPDLAIRETPAGVFVYVADPRGGALLLGRADPGALGAPLDLKPFTDCGTFHRPVAVAARGSRLVVVDTSSVPTIVDCDLEAGRGRERWKGEPLRLPSSVAVTADGTIAVVDRELRGLFVIPPEGKPSIARVGELPLSVRADERGTLYLLDREMGALRVDLTDPKAYEQSQSERNRVVLPPIRDTGAFDVFRDVFYTADGGALRVTVPLARVSLPVPYGRGRPSSVAVSEHYLAVLDAESSAVDVRDRPLAAEAVLDHLAGNPNRAWLDLLGYLAKHALLTTRTVPVQDGDRSYEDVLVRNGVLLRADLSPKLALPPDSAKPLFCALNPGSCAAPFSRALSAVAVPQVTLRASLETGSVALGGKPVQAWVDDRVLVPEQKQEVSEEYLARINPDSGNTLEAEFARLGFVAATPMSRELVPGTVLQIDGGRERVLGPLGTVCSVEVKTTASPTSLFTEIDVPAAALPPELRTPGRERARVVVSGWRRDAIPLTALAGCRPAGETAGRYVVAEALAAMEVRLAETATQKGGGRAVTGPIYLGYKPVPLSGLAAGVARPVTDLQALKPRTPSTNALWTRATGTFTLPVTRWRADVLLPARDYYEDSELAAIRRQNASLDLSARERLRLTAQSALLLQPGGWGTDVSATLAASEKTLHDAISYAEDLALASGGESVTIGIVERRQSVNLDHPGFSDGDQSAWYDYVEGAGLQQHRRAAPPAPAPSPAATPAPAAPAPAAAPPLALRKLVSDFEHGTHVAGIIGARASTLTPGLLPTTNLFLVPGDSLADLKDYIDKARGERVFLFNMSLDFPPAAQSVIGDLRHHVKDFWSDSLFVVAAGNGNDDLNAVGASAPVLWASELPNVIAVAAADEDGNDVLGDHVEPGETQSSRGSNFGSKYIDLLAPGQAVCSLGRDNYAYASGSSQATPQVTATAAMLWSQIRSPALLRARLMYTADWKSLFAGRVWAGLLDVRRAVFFPEANLLTTFSEAAPHQIVLDGTTRVDVSGTEFKRDFSQVNFHDQVAFNRILRMVGTANGRHRLFLLKQPDDTIAVVEGRVTGRVRCKSLTHYDATARRFGASPHDRPTCEAGIDAGQIKDYVAATPGKVTFP